MKKFNNFIMITLLVLSLFGCSQEHNESRSDFSINNWISSIGAVDESSVDIFEEQRFSYTLYLTSETGKLHEVKSVEPIFFDNVLERTISNDPPHLNMENDHIEVQGSIVFDARGLTKEQIIERLDTFINAVDVILEDNTKHLVELKLISRTPLTVEKRTIS